MAKGNKIRKLTDQLVAEVREQEYSRGFNDAIEFVYTVIEQKYNEIAIKPKRGRPNGSKNGIKKANKKR